MNYFVMERRQGADQSDRREWCKPGVLGINTYKEQIPNLPNARSTGLGVTKHCQILGFRPLCCAFFPQTKPETSIRTLGRNHLLFIPEWTADRFNHDLLYRQNTDGYEGKLRKGPVTQNMSSMTT